MQYIYIEPFSYTHMLPFGSKDLRSISHPDHMHLLLTKLKADLSFFNLYVYLNITMLHWTLFTVCSCMTLVSLWCCHNISIISLLCLYVRGLKDYYNYPL